jgi:hypothetical protein
MNMEENEINNPYVVGVCSGSELSEADRAACMAILSEGGAVNVQTVAWELSRASVVATVRRDNVVVGVGTIKRERPDYASEKAESSGYVFDGNTLELGYIAVAKEHRHRGLSSLIVGTLIADCHDRLFATTDDPHMKKTLMHARFTQRGKEWDGQRGRLSLWIRDSRIEVIRSLQLEIRDRIAVFRSKLPASVDGFAISQESKLPFKAVLYREALLWRMTELGSTAYETLDKDLLAAGILLTRGCVETAAAVWYLRGKLEAVTDSGLIGNVDEDLMSLLMGSRNNPDLPKAINVLTFVDRVDKDVKGFRQQYDGLSEFAHPNWSGTTLLYSKPEPQNLGAKLASNIRLSEGAKLIATVNLSVALIVFERSYNRISEIVPDFVSICERRATEGDS